MVRLCCVCGVACVWCCVCVVLCVCACAGVVCVTHMCDFVLVRRCCAAAARLPRQGYLCRAAICCCCCCCSARLPALALASLALASPDCWAKQRKKQGRASGKTQKGAGKACSRSEMREKQHQSHTQTTYTHSKHRRKNLCAPYENNKIICAPCFVFVLFLSA
jgi:hypothetical protein